MTSKVGRLYSSTLTDVAPPRELTTDHSPSSRPSGTSNVPEAEPNELVVTSFEVTSSPLASSSVTVSVRPSTVRKRPSSSRPSQATTFHCTS